VAPAAKKKFAKDDAGLVGAVAELVHFTGQADYIDMQPERARVVVVPE
jgi:hypothetical protein